MLAWSQGTAVTGEQEAIRQAEEQQRRAAVFLAAATRALSVATFHRLDNAAVHTALDTLLAAATPLLRAQGQVELQTIGERVFLNREPIRLRGDAFENALRLRRVFRRMGINELALHGTVDHEELRDFLGRFQAFYASPEPRGFVHEKFDRISVRWVAATASTEAFVEISAAQNAMRSYLGVVAQVDEALEAYRHERAPRIERVRRAVHQLCDAAAEQPGLMAAFARFEGLRGDGAGHAAATAALAALMAQKLGLPRRVVSQVVMAAALHATRADLHLVCGERDDDQIVPRRRLGQVKTVLDVSRGALGNDVLSWMVTAGELSDARASDAAAHIGVLARFVAVPCAFHSMVAPSPGEKALSPDVAVAAVLDGAGPTFDPRVARLFASVVGLFPVGTTVRLNNGATAVVMALSANPAAAASPVVKIIKEGPQTPLDAVLDLDRAREFSISAAVAVEDEEQNPLHFLLG
jgi:hypothetical protein